ncbi:MAG: hypothetical protein JNM74_24530 [Myxococcales bacterium]|nr:hypothetical protein [Myxococcales bacterium]
MSGDQELEAWRAEWQSLGGREGLAQELAGRVGRDGQRIRRGVALEIAGGAFATALSVWLVVRARGELVVSVVCAGILLFVGVWVTRIVTLRQGTFDTMGSGLDAFVALTRRRADDDVRWGRFAMRAMQVLAALLVPWGVWAFVARYALYRAEPWRAVVGFGTAAVILAASLVWQRRKLRKVEAERERFEALVADTTIV